MKQPKASGRRTAPPNASLLVRIEELAVETQGRREIARNLLQGYVACLSFGDLVDATINQLDGPAEVRRVFRNRLTRLAATTATTAELEVLAARLMDLHPGDPLSRTTIDTLLSYLYPHLPLPSRQTALERWMDRGTRGAAARWLKAVRDDESLFDGQAVLAYWRRDGDFRAAKLLAYNAELGLLRSIISELIGRVGEGWIVSRAAIRLEGLSEEDWQAVRQSFPATYAYLCAKLQRPISVDDAVELVREAGGGFDGQRGLAIWAIGEMGMQAALDAVWSIADELERDDLAAMGIVPMLPDS